MHQYTNRPAIRNDVMLSDQQDMLFIFQLQQLAADQRPLSQIERRLSLKLSHCRNAGSVLFCLQRAQVLIREGKADIGRINLLARLSLNQYKTGTQIFVALGQAIERVIQGITVKVTGQA